MDTYLLPLLSLISRHGHLLTSPTQRFSSGVRMKVNPHLIGRLWDQVHEEDPASLGVLLELYQEPPHIRLHLGLSEDGNFLAFLGVSPLSIPEERLRAWNEVGLPMIRPREGGFELGFSYVVPEGDLKGFIHTAIYDFAALARRAWNWLSLGEVVESPIPRARGWPESWQGQHGHLEIYPHPHLVFPGMRASPPLFQGFSGGARLVLPSTPPKGQDPLDYLAKAEALAWDQLEWHTREEDPP